jgi:hypothetical protein
VSLSLSFPSFSMLLFFGDELIVFWLFFCRAENGCFIRPRPTRGNPNPEWINMVANLNMSWKPLCVEMLNYVRISYILFLLFVPSKYPCSLLTHRPFLLPSSPNEHLAHPSTSAKPLSYGGTGLVLPKTRTTDSGPEDRLPRLRTISSTVWENDMVSVSYRERTLSSSYQIISPVLRP